MDHFVAYEYVSKLLRLLSLYPSFMNNSKARYKVTLWARDGVVFHRKNSFLARAASDFPGTYNNDHDNNNNNNTFFAPSDRLLLATQRRRPLSVLTAVSAFSTQPVISSLRQTVRTLRARTNQWLRIPPDVWTAKEVSQGRYLMEAWSQHVEEEKDYDGKNDNRSRKMDTERAMQLSKILKRWLEARSCSFIVTAAFLDGKDSSTEIVEMLHQCLNAWRRIGKHGTATKQSVQEAVHLLYSVDDAGVAVQDQHARPGNKAYSMCFHILAENADDPSVLETLQGLWERRLQGRQQKVDLQVYNSYLHAIAKSSVYNAEAPPLAEQILLELSSVGQHSPTAASFVAVMHAWANRADVESARRAEAILEQLIATNDRNLLCSEAFNVCIDGWAKACQPVNAEALLDRMGEVNVEPTIVSFNSAIHSWATTSAIHPQEASQRAEALLRRIESATKCQPTLESYTAVLDAWSRTNQPGPKVEKLLDRLEERHAQESSFPAPNKWTYLVAIRAWGATRSIGEDDEGDEESSSSSPTTRAQQLVDRMEYLARTHPSRRRDLEPCPIVYSGLLDVWSQSQRSNVPERVMELFHRLPTIVISNERCKKVVFHKVIGILAARGRAKEAQVLLQETILEGPGTVVPDIDSYNLVMMAYAKSRDENAASDALELLREMERKEAPSSTVDPSVKATTTTYIHAMVACGNSPQPNAAEQAEALFWELLDKSQQDDNLTVAANCVLRAWSKSREGGAAQKAESIWKWMEADGVAYGIQPDATSCLHMMQAWAHSGRRMGPAKAESYFLRLKDHALVPGNEEGFVLKSAHFNVLIMAWAKSPHDNALERIQDLVDEMLMLSSTGQAVFPDEFTERWVVQAAKSNKKSAYAMSLVGKLRKIQAKRHITQ